MASNYQNGVQNGPSTPDEDQALAATKRDGLALFTDVLTGIVSDVGNIIGNDQVNGSVIPEGYSNQEMAALGADLRRLAVEFAKSHKGSNIEKLAKANNLKSLTEENLMYVLKTMFIDGLNKKNILTSFLYCTLLISFSLKIGDTNLARDIFTWSSHFICENISLWVHKHGGWRNVLYDVWKFLMHMLVLSGAALGVISLGIYIKNNYKS